MNKLTETELKSVKDLSDKRYDLSAQLGASQYEFESLKAGFESLKAGIVQMIEKSLQDQNVLGEMLIKNHGLDPVKNNCSIDIKTGEIKENK